MTKQITKRLRKQLPPRPPMDEVDLIKRYPWVIPGSLKGTGNNRTVSIKCQHPACKLNRRTRTQDVFQVQYCKKHQEERDAEKSRARRKRWREKDKLRRQAVKEGKA